MMRSRRKSQKICMKIFAAPEQKFCLMIEKNVLASSLRMPIFLVFRSASPSGRGAADGVVEYKMRRDADKTEMTVEESKALALKTIQEEK